MRRPNLIGTAFVGKPAVPEMKFDAAVRIVKRAAEKQLVGKNPDACFFYTFAARTVAKRFARQTLPARKFIGVRQRTF